MKFGPRLCQTVNIGAKSPPREGCSQGGVGRTQTVKLLLPLKKLRYLEITHPCPSLEANPVGVLYEPISESQVLCGVEDSADHID